MGEYLDLGEGERAPYGGVDVSFDCRGWRHRTWADSISHMTSSMIGPMRVDGGWGRIEDVDAGGAIGTGEELERVEQWL